MFVFLAFNAFILCTSTFQLRKEQERSCFGASRGTVQSICGVKCFSLHWKGCRDLNNNWDSGRGRKLPGWKLWTLIYFYPSNTFQLSYGNLSMLNKWKPVETDWLYSHLVSICDGHKFYSVISILQGIVFLYRYLNLFPVLFKTTYSFLYYSLL